MVTATGHRRFDAPASRRLSGENDGIVVQRGQRSRHLTLGCDIQARGARGSWA